jgi:uncharacterized protein (DUF433 family)
MADRITLNQHIVMTPGVAGGKPRIAGHRITVQSIAIWHEWLGWSADEIAAEFDLSLSSVYAALSYYYDHQAEIDAVIHDDEQFITQLRKSIPSKVAAKRAALAHHVG